MLLRRVWFYIRGYVIILVRGSFLEKFVNLAVAEGIQLWDVKRAGPDILTCKAGIAGFKRLRVPLRKSQCRARIKRRVGLAFTVHRVLRRPVLLAGMIVFLGLIYFLSGYVWFVEIQGLKTVKRAEVLRVLADAGVRPGQRRSAINARFAEDEITRRVEGLSWAGLRLRGTVAVVDVVEKEMPRAEAEAGEGDLIAAKDAIVERLYVLKGYPLVTGGQTVHKGDVLISGTPPPPAEPGNEPVPAPVVMAQGTVEGRVWYQSSATVRRTNVRYIRTGKSTTLVMVRVGKQILNLGRKPHYPNSVIRVRSRHLFTWRNGNGFVEVVTRRIDEVKPVEGHLTREEAVQDASGRAWATVRKILSLQKGIQVQKRRQSVSESPLSVTVTAIIEVLEDIAVARPYSSNRTKGGN